MGIQFTVGDTLAAVTAQPLPAAAAKLSRRSLLIGALAVAATACTSHGQRASFDPDSAALSAARDTEHRLLASYDAAHPAYAAHLAHLRALGGPIPSPSPANAPTPASPAAAAAAERASVAQLQGAADAAVHGSNAALLASIAASHAVLGGAAR